MALYRDEISRVLNPGHHNIEHETPALLLDVEGLGFIILLGFN